jgi:hypothetical protein
MEVKSGGTFVSSNARVLKKGAIYLISIAALPMLSNALKALTATII